MEADLPQLSRSPVRSCTLHIGTEKTGTTLIQNALFARKSALASHGWLYPGAEVSHWQLARAAANPDRWAAAHQGAIIPLNVEALRREIADAPRDARVIVSSEHFHSRILDGTDFARLKELLARLRLRVDQIVVYFRPQAELLISRYGESVKWGNTNEFSASQSVLEHNYDHYGIAKLWSEAFPSAHITISSYYSAVRSGRLLEDFSEKIGLPAHLLELASEYPANRSLPWPWVEFRRRLNAHGHLPRPGDLTAVLESWPVDPKLAARGWSREEVGLLQQTFEPGNALLCREYGLNAAEFPVFGSPPQPRLARSAREIEREAETLFIRLWSAYTERVATLELQTTELEVLAGRLLHLEQDSASLGVKTASLSAEVQALAVALSGAERERDSALAGAEALRGVVAQVAEERDALLPLRPKFSTALNRIAQLEAERRDERRRSRALDSTLSGVAAARDSALAGAGDLRALVTALAHERDDLLQLRPELDESRNVVLRLEAELDSRRRHAAGLEGALTGVAVERDSALAGAGDLRALVTALAQERDDLLLLRPELDEARNTILRLEAELDSQRRHAAGLEGALTGVAAERDSALAGADDLRRVLDDVVRERDRLMREALDVAGGTEAS